MQACQRKWADSVRIHKAGVCALCLGLLLSAGVQSRAITPNDIRGAYGVALSQDVAPLLTEAFAVEQRLKQAQAVETYNAVLQDYTPEHLDSSIELLATELDKELRALQSGIDMPFDQMLMAEADYSKRVTEVNQLLQARDFIQNNFTFLPVTDDSAELRLSLDTLQEEISKAGRYADIGAPDVWPVVGMRHQVNSGFGTRWDPITKAAYSYHSGIDLYAPMGTSVATTYSGTVYQTGYSTGSGNYIYVDHGYGVKTFYCHLSEILVTKGQDVTQGTIIAKSGNTGTRTTGPHLHYGVYIDGKACDPKVVLPE